MTAVALLLAAFPALALVCTVLVCCAVDALAPQPVPQPRDFQRLYTLDRARARRAQPPGAVPA